MLEGAGFRKPTAVHVHGFLTVNGEKMSKSRGTFVTARRYLERFRRIISATSSRQSSGPGLEDIDMNLDEFATRINADLVGKLVNIASRCASFIHRGFGGRLATACRSPASTRNSSEAGSGIMEAWESLEYAAAVREIMALADRANLYIDRQKPWLAAKDPARAAEVQAVCTQGINLFRVLMTYLKPVLPMITQRAEAFLNHRSRIGAKSTSRFSAPQLANTSRSRPAWTRRACRNSWRFLCLPMRPLRAAEPVKISAEEFARIDLRVARVETAEFVEGADRLLRLSVDLGGERRTVFAGIRGAYEPDNSSAATS